ncbi:MAG: DUF427 domain-containing protein [Nitrospirales bacterium]|nr:DUF427 domain-containing protein [Nitrospirales bacterium]
MNTPGHLHAITIEKNPNRIKVTFNRTVIADTRQALILREGLLPPVNYIPRENVYISYFQRTSHTTRYPLKGDASYFTVSVEDRIAENAVWTYETSFSSVADIKNHVVFYPEKMNAIEGPPHEG